MSERRAGGEELLPVFDALEEVEHRPISRGRPPSRRGLGPARGAGIAAALLVLLVAGIAVGSLPKAGDPSERPSASPASTGDAIAVAPTTRTGDCRPQSMARYPMLSLSVTGVPYAVDATLGAGYHIGEEPITGGTWVVPPLSGSLYLPQPETLDLSPDLGACLTRVVILETASATIPNLVDAKLLYDGNFDPAVSGLTFGRIEAGDWVLRVEAHYDTQETGVVPELVTFSYLRVIAGEGPVVTDIPAVTPEPSPVATPITPCGSTPPSTNIVVALSGGSGDAVPGIADVIPSAAPEVPPEIPYVTVGLGDPVRIDVAGAVCAVSWEIRLMDPYSGQVGDVYHVSNPNDDPKRAVQNHWEIPIEGEQYVIATLHFPGGPTITRTWHVVPAGFPVPAAFLVARDGTRFQASAGCGLTLGLANGYSSGDSCGSIGYSPGDDALQVHAFEPVTFEIPGWGLQSWNGLCGTVPDDGSETFNDNGGCRLGAATSDAGGLLTDPVSFVLPPGDAVVRIYVTAIGSNGDQYSVAYFAHVIAR
jgi:hypothetical protein